MVHEDIWEQAWAGRRKRWQKDLHGRLEILCIGCLEERKRPQRFGDGILNPKHPFGLRWERIGSPPSRSRIFCALIW
jgi:hypothetical protein